MTREEHKEGLDSAFYVVSYLQFLIPILLTVIVSTLKLVGFILVSVPWVIILLPAIVSISVGLAMISIIMLTKLFMKLGDSNV